MKQIVYASIGIMAGSVLATSFWRLFCPRNVTVIISELDGNLLYQDVHDYLSAEMFYLRIRPRRIKMFNSGNDADDTYELVNDEKAIDVFEGFKFSWIHRCHEEEGAREVCYYELTFPERLKDVVFESYLPFISKKAASTKKHQLFGMDKKDNWSSGMTFDHPSSFDNLAIDPEVKRRLIDDLDMFVAGESWKRGYFLYGPTGTGKTYLIAAMAKYLEVDVYELNLNSVSSDSHLRRLLRETSTGSMIVVENIDLYIGFKKTDDSEDNVSEGKKKTLLEFIDRSWSRFSGKRIFVFTTMFKENVDPAFLEPRRMDLQIHLSYMTPGAFEVLALTHAGIITDEHKEEIKDLLLKTKVSCAEVSERLSQDDPLEKLMEFLRAKRT